MQNFQILLGCLCLLLPFIILAGLIWVMDGAKMMLEVLGIAAVVLVIMGLCIVAGVELIWGHL